MALPSNAHLIWHPFAGVCMHDYLTPLPPPLAPITWFFIDFGIVHGVTGLFAYPTAKFPYPPALRSSHGEILDMGVPMEGHGTDATLFVPHVPVPFNPNWLLLLIIMFGSSKILMASNKTRIWCRGLSPLTGELEEAVGCCVFPSVPLSLNLQCWDLKAKRVGEGLSIPAPMPTDVVVAPNTVQVGIQFSDYLAALVEWGIEIAIAALMAVGTKKAGKAWDEHSASKVTKAGNEAAMKARKEAMEQGLDKAAQKKAAKEAREAAEAAASKRGKLSTLYHGIADTRYGKQYLVGLGAKLPYKLLVKNTEWYREGVQRPVTDAITENRRG
jgi:hypothetical protein